MRFLPAALFKYIAENNILMKQNVEAARLIYVQKNMHKSENLGWCLMYRKIFAKAVNFSLAVAISSLCIICSFDAPLLTDGIKAAHAAAAQTAVVTGSHINLRSGPGTNHDVLGTVNQGDKLPILDKQGDWYKVQKSDGQAAWIAGWLVKVENSTASKPSASNSPDAGGSSIKYAVITANNVNVRSGPGTGYQVVGSVNSGERYQLLAVSDQWYKLKLPNGEAWAAGWLTKVEQVQAPEPPVNQTPSDDTGQQTDEQPAWLPPLDLNQDDPATADDAQDQKDDTYDKDSPHLTDLDIDKEDDKTVVTVESNAKINYNTFMLTNPDRLVVNFEGFDLGEIPETTKKINSSTVKSLRTGQYSTEPKIARIVLDLNGPANYRTKVSNNGKVLTVEASEIKYGEYIEDKVIFIDAGHGGDDPGAPGNSRTIWEETVNLDISQKLSAILKQQGAKVIMSRTGDQTVDLLARPELANRANADIFVSIHCNSNINTSIGGTTTYYYAPTTRKDLFEQQADRMRLAQCIQNEMVKELKLENRGIRQDNFAVLRETSMPSVLVETAFISNPREEALLKDDRFRQRIAEAVARGINAYFAE